jgi:hypothetical protein
MNPHALEDRITALAPVPEQLDQAWAEATLSRILSDKTQHARSRDRRAIAAIAIAGALTVGTGTAVAAKGFGSVDAVRDLLIAYGKQPNTSAHDIGTLGTPRLVAQFRRSNGDNFAFWIATSSSGAVCFAYSDASWNGEGAPTPSQLEYGCGGEVVDSADPTRPIPLERPEQLGGFFKDEAEPILYGVSPYAEAAAVQVHGTGVDVTLPVRSDSHGYGSTLPTASDAESLTLTFLDAAGRALGTRTVVAPVG